MLGPVSPTERKRAWAHLRAVAEQHKVKLHATKQRWTAESHIATSQAWVPRTMKAPIDYLIGLHEIGHVASATARRLTFDRRHLESELAVEGAAWAWAIEHADPDTLALAIEDDWDQIGAALTSFLRLA